MAITDSNLRSNVFTDMKAFLTSASLSASDLQNSSISPTFKGVYTNSASDLPCIVINNASITATDKIAFNDGFDSQKNVFVELQIFSKNNAHIDQLSDQIHSAFQSSTLTGLSLIGWDEDYLLTEPSNNTVHMKSLFLTFQRW